MFGGVGEQCGREDADRCSATRGAGATPSADAVSASASGVTAAITRMMHGRFAVGVEAVNICAACLRHAPRD
jgi:hypothetical protein